MDIYWIADKKKCGPATVPDVLSLVQMGELTPDTRGWHAGCEKWMPLRELPALADFLEEKPEPEPAEELPPVPDSAAEERPPEIPAGAVRVYLPSPATRLLARLVDMALFMALLFGVIYVREIPFIPSLLPSGPVVWIAFIALEAGLIYFLGTTPGKALLGIQVRPVGEAPMTLGRSFARSCWVFLSGMGMMISILPLFMMGYSWWILRSRGITMWDARCGTLPLQFKPTTLLRQFMAVLVLFFCFHAFSYCIKPWMPAFVDAVEQQSPEAGKTLRKWMQVLPDTAEKKA